MATVDRRTFLAASAAMLSAGLTVPEAAGGSETRTAPARPNILFVNTDDQARWAVGAYGNSEIHTPNMDRLAAEGMRFTRAFTCPVCSPSRAMTMTGCYNHQVGIHDWIGRQEPVGLPANVPTLADELRRAGYRTGLVGKWHLGHARPGHHPGQHGFDFFAGFLAGSAPVMDPELMVEGMTRRFEGGLTDVLADQAIGFLRTYREQPFALFFHPFRPHAPYVPVPDEDWEPYRGRKLGVRKVEGVEDSRLREITGKYYASVSSVDRNLGRILRVLEETGQLDNTIIVFTGDNGYNIGQHGLWHKGNGSLLATGRTRPNMFDTSCMVPYIVRWPGMVQPGSVCDEMVSSLDSFPTLLEAAGIRRRPGVLLEGMSMMPLLQGESTAWRDELYLIYDQHHYDPHARMRMVRTDDWKLVFHREPGMGHELYNLASDPEEERNLYDDPQARSVRAGLEKKLVLWERRTGAPAG